MSTTTRGQFTATKNLRIEGGIASPEALEVLYDRLQERFPHHIWRGVLSDLADLAVCNPDLIPRTLDILELNCRILGPRARFVRLYLEIYEDDRRAVMENVRTILESGHVSLGSLEEDQALRILAMGVRDPRYGVSSTARDVMVNVCQVEPESE